MGNLQINASLTVVFDIPWPPVYTQFIDFLSVFKLDVFKGLSFAAPCLHSSHFMSLASFILLPLILLMVFGSAFLVVAAISKVNECLPFRCRHKVRKLPCCKFNIRSARTSMAKILLITILFIYPTICSKVFMTFKCVNVGATGSFMFADMSIACYEVEWFIWAAVSCVAMVVYIVGIPIGLVLLLGIAQRRGTLQYPYLTLAAGNATPGEVAGAVDRTQEFFSNRLRYGNSTWRSLRPIWARTVAHTSLLAPLCRLLHSTLPHQCTTNTSLNIGGSSSAARCAR
jgi:hypothetical protein